MHETATFVLVKLTNIHRFKKWVCGLTLLAHPVCVGHGDKLCKHGRVDEDVVFGMWTWASDTIRIRDAILTCARKPTRVSLIYRTEPTTKKCKNRKTKSRKQICSEITVISLGIRVVNHEEEKGRAAVGKICRKGKF